MLSDFSNIISSLAVLTTILQFLSGTLVCKQYVLNRTTAEASPLPFTCGILSTGLWLLYGLQKHDDKIVLVNTVGITLMIAYTVVFYIFSFKKSVVVKQAFAVVVALIFTLTYAVTEADKTKLLENLGFLACLLTLLTVAAPMSKLLYVIKVKSTECLPYPMIVMSLFVCTLWFLYGQIIGDPFLQIPNFIGAVLALFQLSLFVILPNTTDPLLVKNVLAL